MADDEYDLWDTLNLQPGASLEECELPTNWAGREVADFFRRNFGRSEGVFFGENGKVIFIAMTYYLMIESMMTRYITTWLVSFQDYFCY